MCRKAAGSVGGVGGYQDGTKDAFDKTGHCRFFLSISVRHHAAERCSLGDDGLLCREVRIIRLSQKSNDGELAVVIVVPASSCSAGSVMQFKTLAPTEIALQPGDGDSMMIRLFPDEF